MTGKMIRKFRIFEIQNKSKVFDLESCKKCGGTKEVMDIFIKTEQKRCVGIVIVNENNVKNNDIFIRIATGISDMVNHRMNRIELFETICACISAVTEEDKQQIINSNPIGNNYLFAKNWLTKK